MTTSPPPTRRWSGVLFALFAPGFGHFRAGMWLRGWLWFFSVYGMTLVCVTTFTHSLFPVWLGLVAVVLAAGLNIAMLCGSFRPGRMTRKLWGLFAMLFVLRVLLAEAREHVLITYTITSGAMEPTFMGRGENRDKTPDYVVVDKLSHRINGLKRGDIIVFSTAGIGAIEHETVFTQRLVGMPGERVEIKDQAVYIDGRRLTEADGIPPLAYHPAWSPQGEAHTFDVEPGTWFVLGDNSKHSYDSRYWGGVPAANVVGTVSKIYYPFNRIGGMRRMIKESP